MTRSRVTGTRAVRKPVIVLAGEDDNDRKVMRYLLEAFCPAMTGRLVEIKDKVRLRQATGENLRARVEVIVGKARARAAREAADCAGIFIHEDFDGCESANSASVRQRVQKALDSCGIPSRYVLAAWEIEAWLLLFPDALADLHSGWKVPARYRGRDTGLIADPKAVLQRELGKASVRYRESDAPAVVAAAIRKGLHENPSGKNVSFSAFRADASASCQRLSGRS